MHSGDKGAQSTWSAPPSITDRPYLGANSGSTGARDAVLDGHVVFSDDTLSFITFDDEHHRVALLHPPAPTEKRSALAAAMHHTAYTFETLDDLLDRHVLLRDRGILPAVCIAHGVTSSMYSRDPDGNFVEMQIDVFADPHEATAYMNGPEFAGDSVGPGFDPEAMLVARRAGATVEQLTSRAFCVDAGLPAPIVVLTSAP